MTSINETTIALPSDLVAQLKVMATNYKEQNNRCTAKPYYFTIRERDRVYGVDPAHGFDDSFVWVHNKYYELSYEPDDVPEDFKEDDYARSYYMLTDKYTGVFFTEQEADRHLRINRHHYNETAVTYVNHAFRNCDMDTIVYLFDSLVDNPT